MSIKLLNCASKLQNCQFNSTIFFPLISYGNFLFLLFVKCNINMNINSGSGGQNVNKLSTKCELRFNVDYATWMPEEVRARFRQQNETKINKAGEYIVTAETQRTQVKYHIDLFSNMICYCKEMLEFMN